MRDRLKELENRRRRGRLSWFAGGAAIGLASAFYADPVSGPRRRALTRDRTAGLVRRTARRLARWSRIAGAYTVGWSNRLLHLREEPKEYDDATLAQKVKTEIFRPADAPKGSVDVNVANGIVQLRGEVEHPEMIEELVDQVRGIQGVRDVESFLHLPRTPAPTDR
jgi:BON domain